MAGGRTPHVRDDVTPSDQAHPSDAELLARCGDDPSSFAVIYDRYADDVHRFVLRRLGRDLADDLTADTFTAAFRQRDRFDGTRASARPWLFGIAANLIGKHRRTEVRALRAVTRLQTDPVSTSWEESADDRLAASSAGPALATALAKLSVPDRHVLLLVAWADLSYAEVAEALGIPLGTVRSRLNRARTRVRLSLAHDPTFTRSTLHLTEAPAWTR
jgi:RNA polymerase sigma factor (sigma-70 family)